MKLFKLNIFILSVLFLTSCDKGDSQTPSLNGAYKGTFTMTNNDPAADSVPLSGDVTVTFSKSDYLSSAGINNIPAGGQGKYSLKNNEINFTDNSVRTDNYDWSLALSGSYTYTTKSDSLILIKKNGYNSYTYKLKKQ